MNDSRKNPFGVIQSPLPGESMVLYCGDSVTFCLTLSEPAAGKAWVRTNLGTANIARREIIARVEKEEIRFNEAWHDIEMAPEGDARFALVLPLVESGFFQAKCFFLPGNSTTPVWPEGENSILNVEPAGTCCANIIYNAFVRQFGRSKSGPTEDPSLASRAKILDAEGYTVIPESGKFRDLKKEVEFIFSRLGCRALHLLPVHPTPTTYARMGRFGSPYAALNFTDVDPAMAEFDPSATPLEQFMELVDEVHCHGGYLILDIAINHTGWAAAIHETHPEWLVREEDGRIREPGAWGVVWADLTKLDFTHKDLWQYMAEIFLLWCHRGVDGFRCDAGYMVPVDAWEYMVAKVREEYPDTLFFLEGLGGPLETTREILGRGNFNWAYSELFQNYTAEEITAYLPFAWELSRTCGHLIHFAETHDNNRLASVSKEYARMRTALSALFSVCGGFGFANGVEWFATEKINVHESLSLNWGAEENQVETIARINRILKVHPAFFNGTRLELIQKSQSQTLALLRYNKAFDKRLLILVNLDWQAAGDVAWEAGDLGIAGGQWIDLISGDVIVVKQTHEKFSFRLAPAQVLALTPDPGDLEILGPDLDADDPVQKQIPQKVLSQKYKAKVLSAYTAVNGYSDISGLDLDRAGNQLAADPVELIRSLNPDSEESRVIPYDVDKDLNRQVMVPPGFFLLIRCRYGFRAEILDRSPTAKTSLGYEEGLPVAGKDLCFALFLPIPIKKRHREYVLTLRIFKPGSTRVEEASILYLAPLDSLLMRSTFSRREILDHPRLMLLGTTRLGGMMRAAASWGELYSRYDGLLGANLDPAVPENRWMVFARCRIWAIFQGYSRELALDCLETFTFSYKGVGRWLFHIPTSEGKYYNLELCLGIAKDDNRIFLSITRKETEARQERFLENDKPISLVFRPDIEDRSFHETIKAFQGPEQEWPRSVSPFEAGFDFSLSRNKVLQVCLPGSRFVPEPEWQYMVHRPLETERGLDDASDLFSPGYFTLECLGGDRVCLEAVVLDDPESKTRPEAGKNPEPPSDFEAEISVFQAVSRGLDAFLVERNKEKSVIAGYPWFLDWGRDSLIFCRSLIELGRIPDAQAVLRLFGRFEDQGTLPNMICGHQAGNIETSDAPLWFLACCRDLMEKTGNRSFLDQDLGGRTLEQVVISLAESLVKGTKTGVRADPETLLLYSPSHYTWMDTNFPAGSPRQGYPIEIQALWYNALGFLAEMAPFEEWGKKAQTVRESIIELFWNGTLGYFSDCRHSKGPVPAKDAEADDALRPNQLLLFSLGVIDQKNMARRAVEACLGLLVPGGIRSLADQRIEVPLQIFHRGRLLKDPHFPYSGRYLGDEDTQRKPAYHNGTAWTWPFPVFCEAWAQIFGKKSHPTCLAWLGSVIQIMRTGAAGYIPEILDGDFPHSPRGCDAQAWGVSETARVIHKLSVRSG
ncbi:amylo-alpha-1,6-glucosidase [Desulfospira joergensenii]|uniref:amylo-alpha-1,6-glucosidase n=1 Tax=Desulfospira joergensenii TaxID=53329 RepID=UPI0003B663D5|nr:amylo-alpha-1,6-glucosidase [Desulfospira joergensenii]